MLHRNTSVYDVRGYARRRPSPWRWLWPVGAVLVLGLLAILALSFCRREPATPAEPTTTNTSAAAEQPAPPPHRRPLAWRVLQAPTALTNLADAKIEHIAQPTASGNPESGAFGTVRTGESGLGQFHEGIDIRALARDRRGAPLDEVRAAADGRVAYASRIAGNSNYGKYVVLLHEDPMGDVYSLYAHLADVETDLRPGLAVVAGRKLGRMGNTSSSAIPMDRAHLHFEVGVLVNERFGDWYRRRALKPDHGNWHGWNLLGVDPLAAFRFASQTNTFSLQEYFKSENEAFRIAIRAPALPDYFRRYPSLWQGPAFDGTPIVLAATENGVPLWGRTATPAELTVLGKLPAAVLAADGAALGRNGRRLVQRSGETWRIGSNGDEWLELLLFPARLR